MRGTRQDLVNDINEAMQKITGDESHVMIGDYFNHDNLSLLVMAFNDVLKKVEKPTDPLDPERINLAAETLAALVKEVAARREAKGNYVSPKSGSMGGHYILDLRDMNNENPLSFAVFLMLDSWWNDALDWAEDPSKYVA